MPSSVVGYLMIKTFLFALFLLIPFAAQAEEGVIELEGNAKVITGGNARNTYVYRNYNTDDLIVRNLFGVEDYYYPRNNKRIPPRDSSSICDEINRASERRRCREDFRDLDEDRGELLRKYSN